MEKSGNFKIHFLWLWNTDWSWKNLEKINKNILD